MTVRVRLSVFFIFLGVIASAQDSKINGLSLQECVQLAIKQNISVEKARIDIEKSGYRVSETRAAMLPKVNINGNFTDFIEKSKTLLPGIIVGREGNLVVEMGTQFNTNASVNLTQVLYNLSALTAMKIARQMESIDALTLEKIYEELSIEISKLYFLTLTTARQQTLIEENIARTTRLRDIIQVLVENGMGRETDFERININLENLYTQLDNTIAAHEQQLNIIKYMLHIPLEETIVLTDDIDMPLLRNAPELSDFSEHIDFKLLDAQMELNRFNQSMIKAGYMPTVSFVGQYGLTGYRDEFKNYFRTSAENKWFASSYIGLSVSIPVFDGFEKRSKMRQATLDYRKTAITLDNTRERFSINYQNALNNHQNHQTNVERQLKNIALAEKVFQETALKYREGLATMSDVLQDVLGLNNAQAAYLNALYQLREAELNILSLSSDLGRRINTYLNNF